MLEAMPPVDESLCPLCNQPNLCVMASKREENEIEQPCWCVGLDFSADLLARVPQSAKKRACICARCQAQASAQNAN